MSGRRPVCTPVACDATRRAALHLLVARMLLEPGTRDALAADHPDLAEEAGCVATALAGAAPGTCPSSSLQVPGDALSAFVPVGRYAGDPDLAAFFRAVRWLQLGGFGLASDAPADREAQEPTAAPEAVPVEDVAAAAALAFAARRADVLPLWDELEQMQRVLYGEADGPTPDDLLTLLDLRGWWTVGDVVDALGKEAPRAAFAEAVLSGAFGEQRLRRSPTRRTIRFSVLAPRLGLDGLVFDATGKACPKRLPHELEPLWALGDDTAWAILEPSLRCPGVLPSDDALYAALHDARAELAAVPPEVWKGSLHHRWAAALRLLQPNPVADARRPALVRTPAWRTRMLHTQAVSYAHLRHDAVLFVPPGMISGVLCAFPDAWVDPYPEAFREVAALARDLQALLDASTVAHKAAFHRLGRLSEVSDRLAALAQAQLDGRRLSDEDLDWVNTMVRHVRPKGGCGGGDDVAWQGWLPQILPEGATDGDEPLETVALLLWSDGDRTQARQLSVGSPHLAVVVVDRGDGPAAFVGALQSLHVSVEPDASLTDEAWRARWHAAVQPPPAWSADLWTGERVLGERVWVDYCP